MSTLRSDGDIWIAEAGQSDFSDTSETCWIFGFSGLKDTNDFFDEFLARK